MIPTLPRDIAVPPSALKRRFAICTIRLMPISRHHYEVKYFFNQFYKIRKKLSRVNANDIFKTSGFKF